MKDIKSSCQTEICLTYIILQDTQVRYSLLYFYNILFVLRLASLSSFGKIHSHIFHTSQYVLLKYKLFHTHVHIQFFLQSTTIALNNVFHDNLEGYKQNQSMGKKDFANSVAKANASFCGSLIIFIRGIQSV